MNMRDKTVMVFLNACKKNAKLTMWLKAGETAQGFTGPCRLVICKDHRGRVTTEVGEYTNETV